MLQAKYKTMKGEVDKPIYFEDNLNEFNYWSIHQENCLSLPDRKHICSPDGNIIYMIDAANQGNNSIVKINVNEQTIKTIYPYTLQDLFSATDNEGIQQYIRLQANLSNFEGELTLEHAIKKLDLFLPSQGN